MSFYSKSKKLLAGLIRKLFRAKIYGAENESENGAYLICANHLSECDPFIIGACIKHNPRYMAKKELMKVPIVGKLITAWGAYPIDRGGNDVGAIRHTIELLKSGESVIMFPQGTRCPGVDPKTTKIKFGCAMIALRADVPILPIYLKSKKYKISILKRTHVIIGKPITAEELRTAAGEDDNMKMCAEFVFSRITELDGNVK